MREDCVRFEESLLLSIAGELEKDRAPSLEAHLASCAECAAKREALERTDQLLKEAWVPALSAQEWEDLALHARPAPIRFRALAWAAAVLALLVPATLYATLEPPRGAASGDPDPSAFAADL